MHELWSRRLSPSREKTDVNLPCQEEVLLWRYENPSHFHKPNPLVGFSPGQAAKQPVDTKYGERLKSPQTGTKALGLTNNRPYGIAVTTAHGGMYLVSKKLIDS